MLCIFINLVAMTTYAIPPMTKIKIWVFTGVLISNYRSFSRLMLIYLTSFRIKQLWYDMIQQLKPFRINKPGCHDKQIQYHWSQKSKIGYFQVF